MRILFKIICLILLSTSAMSQVQQPSNLPSSGSINNWTIGRYSLDSGKLFIERDTFPSKYPALIKHFDHKFYYTNGNGGFWFPLVSVGAGTVSMANSPLYINGLGAIVNADTGRMNGQLVTGGDLNKIKDSVFISLTLDQVLLNGNVSARSAQVGRLGINAAVSSDRLLSIGGPTTSTDAVQYGAVINSRAPVSATTKYTQIATGVEIEVAAALDSVFALRLGRTNYLAGSSVSNMFALFQEGLTDRVYWKTNNFGFANLPSFSSGGTYAVFNNGVLSTRTAAQLKADIAAGDGTVTSIGLTSSDIVVGGTSPITTSGTYTLTLTNTLTTPGTFGSSILIPIITVDAKGRVTSITSTAFTSGSGTLTSWSFTNNTYFIGTTINATSAPQFSLSPSSNALYITNVGTLLGLTVSGNVSGNTFFGSGIGLTGIIFTAQGTAGQISSTGTQNLIFNLADVNNNIGTFNNVTLNAKGQATSATNVAYLTNNQTITFTASGDVIASATGTTAISPVFTLTNVLVTPGTFGSNSQIPVFTVDAKGRVTGITSVAANVGTVTSFSFTNSAFFIGTTLNPGTTPQLSISPSANATYVTSVGTLFSLTVANSLNANSITSSGYVLAYSYVFNPVPSPSFSPWSIVADAVSGQFLIMTNNPNLSLNVGYEQRVTVMNNTGSIITNGSAVYKNGSAVGENGTVALAQANALSTTLLIGVATESIGIGMTGSVTYQGIVHGVNTSTYNKGDKLYLDPTTPGALTNVAPTSPNLVVLVGEVGVVSASTGTIYVASYYLPSTIAASGVISITGTQSQILASAATGAVTLTLSPALILPGSLTMSAGFTNTGTTSLAVTTLLTTTITGNLTVSATSVLTIISTTLGPTARADIKNLSVIGNANFGGSVIATTFTGALSGNATTATTLATGRTIGVSSPDMTAVATSFNGSANIAIPITLTVVYFGASSVNGLSTTPQGRVIAYSPLTAAAQFLSLTTTGAVTAAYMSATSALFNTLTVSGVTLTGGLTSSSNGVVATLNSINSNAFKISFMDNGVPFGYLGESYTSPLIVSRTGVDSVFWVNATTGTGNIQRNANASTTFSVTNTDATNTSSRAGYTATAATVQGIIQSVAGSVFYAGTLSTHPFDLYTNSIQRISISSAGAVQVLTLAGVGARTVLASSDGTLTAPVSDSTVKQNISPLLVGLDEVMRMNPVSFEYRKGWAEKYGTGTHMGQLAQEMKDILPGMVFYDAKTQKYGINYGHGDLEAVIIKAIQTLKLKSDAADEKNLLLEARLAKIEAAIQLK